LKDAEKARVELSNFHNYVDLPFVYRILGTEAPPYNLLYERSWKKLANPLSAGQDAYSSNLTGMQTGPK